ncbi:hypothetical protein SAMN05428969_3051 [Devosia sp. YR412]|uniref:hypothetical protein n=1 Tax=Devosia sp. YR412 TaxID=1881030 RepID=UPI0008CD91D8|nr:hypothetical protein [Devosia sp. YR412]SEQ42709.1 hypothetical protein SAMN05428969_3051 [Devosia sp. YR412]
MFSLTAKSLLAAALVTGLALANPVAAQDFPPAKLSLVAANGDALDYTVSDASIYLSTTAAYEGTPAATELTLSLSTIAPMNAELLGWASQADGKSKTDYGLVLVTTTTDADGTDREVRYEISGATVNSISTSVSTYATQTVSLSLTGGKLVLDGVAMN